MHPFVLGFTVAAPVFTLGAIYGAAITVSIPDPRAIMCAPGYAESRRLHGAAYERMRDAAFAAAGIPTSLQCHSHDDRPVCYILDHILPLELGGSNDPPNLQIQTREEAEVKDQMLENPTTRAYCAGQITLEQAKARFVRSRK